MPAEGFEQLCAPANTLPALVAFARQGRRDLCCGLVINLKRIIH